MHQEPALPALTPSSNTRYELGEPLGHGGMGEVFSARDLLIGRDVAVKRLRGELADIRLERFMREACIQGRLDHPSIVPVHELAIDSDGVPYFVMKKLKGTTLAQIIVAPSPAKHTRQRLLRAFVECCLAVEFAHTRGYIHRDLKPENIVLGEFGEVYVIDWGLAKMIAAPDPGTTADMHPVDDVGSGTREGMAVGTPGYMAPEQARADKGLDARVDVYALGCVLFELLAGEPLHPRGMAGMRSALRGVDARPSARAPGRDIAPELDAICVYATALDRDSRPATARALAELVERFLDGDRDLELRKRLSRECLEAASEASSPAHVMRLAGRALALDPESTDAAKLITGVLLEPPATPPAGLVAQLAATDTAVQQRQGRVAFASFAAVLAFLGALAWNGVTSWPLLGLLGGWTVMLALAASRTARRAIGRREMLLIAAVNALLVALMSRAFGPVVIAPGLACIVTLSQTSYPQNVDRPRTIIAIVVLAWLAPVVLEWLGVLGTTWRVVDGAIVSSSAMVTIGGVPTTALIVFGHVATLVVLGLFAGKLAASRRELQRTLETREWHWRQLLPQTTSGRPR